jgi:predicted PurR-regulated permease PerM
MMFRVLLFRLSRRRAVATIIGGLIILSLILTALGTMVFVSQQYDQYQQTATKMAQHQNQGQSENLVANSPGLTANLAWSGCGGCNI